MHYHMRSSECVKYLRLCFFFFFFVDFSQNKGYPTPCPEASSLFHKELKIQICKKEIVR